MDIIPTTTKDAIMFKNILLPTDGSSLSDKAIRAGIEFASKNDSRIVVLSVAEPYPYSPLADNPFAPDAAAYEEKMRSLADGYVKKVAEAANLAKVPVETCVSLSFSPYEEIVKTAKNFHCDVIFMASHGRKGLNKLFIGSETQKVLAHTDLPVLVFR